MGEKSNSQIVEETGQSQSNVSNHLSCLIDCGFVQNRRDGKKIFYSSSPAAEKGFLVAEEGNFKISYPSSWITFLLVNLQEFFLLRLLAFSFLLQVLIVGPSLIPVS